MDTKAILFDFMGVLLFRRENYQSEPLVDEIDNLIGQVTNDNIFKEKILTKFHLTDSDFDDILKKIVEKYTPLTSIWKMLPSLRQQFRLAIVNNGTALTLPMFKVKYKLDKNFDLFVSSAIEGIRKPSSEIYLLTSKRLKVQPQECLFMDDSKTNIEAAEKLGMQVIWWENKESGFNQFLRWTKN